MSTWLRALLAVQLVVFAGWGAKLLTSHRDAGVVWLATEPVDPRDLLSGHYVALRYPIASAGREGCEGLTAADAAAVVFIQLVAGGDPVPTSEGPVVLSEAVTCRRERPARGSGTWIMGRVDDGGRVVYGIERMFVAEDSPLREARSGTVVAQVALNELFEPRLIALVTKATEPAAQP